MLLQRMQPHSLGSLGEREAQTRLTSTGISKAQGKIRAYSAAQKPIAKLANGTTKGRQHGAAGGTTGMQDALSIRVSKYEEAGLPTDAEGRRPPGCRRMDNGLAMVRI